MLQRTRPTPDTGPEWMSFTLGVLIGVTIVLGALYILVRLLLLDGGSIFLPETW